MQQHLRFLSGCARAVKDKQLIRFTAHAVFLYVVEYFLHLAGDGCRGNLILFGQLVLGQIEAVFLG
ncbi:hypothetical protein D3C74_501080 [compost metagenome]